MGGGKGGSAAEALRVLRGGCRLVVGVAAVGSSAECWDGAQPREGGHERPFFRMTEQVLRPGPLWVMLDLGASPEESRRELAELAQVAVETANALAAEGAERCRRKHQQLARDLGLAKPRPGF
jgi:hypothetical protein